MHRRTALQSGSLGILTLLTGCASLRGMFLGKVPKSYKIHNDSSSKVDLQVTILAVRAVNGEVATETLSSQTFELSPGQKVSPSWPYKKVETYRIEAKTSAGEETAYSFSPSLWHSRHTPFIRVSREGVAVSVRESGVIL